MTKVVSALTARTQFGQILKLASKKSQRFIVDRRGEPLAVIMGIQDFIKTVAPEPEVLKAIGEASKRKGTDKLTMREIDAEIKAVRRAKRKQHAA
jgi:prevent-host-death family protein